MELCDVSFNHSDIVESLKLTTGILPNILHKTHVADMPGSESKLLMVHEKFMMSLPFLINARFSCPSWQFDPQKIYKNDSG